MTRLAFFAQLDTSSLPGVSADTSTLQNVLSVFFSIAGGIAVLVITVAGFYYIKSRGDPQSTARAKDAIIYAAVGLAICLAAFTIVNLVGTSI